MAVPELVVEQDDRDRRPMTSPPTTRHREVTWRPSPTAVGGGGGGVGDLDLATRELLESMVDHRSKTLDRQWASVTGEDNDTGSSNTMHQLLKLIGADLTLRELATNTTHHQQTIERLEYPTDRDPAEGDEIRPYPMVTEPARLAPLSALQELQMRADQLGVDEWHRSLSGVVSDRDQPALAECKAYLDELQRQIGRLLCTKPRRLAWQIKNPRRVLIERIRDERTGQVIKRPRKVMVESAQVLDPRGLGRFRFRFFPAGDAGASPGFTTLYLWRDAGTVSGRGHRDGDAGEEELCPFMFQVRIGQVGTAPRLWPRSQVWYRVEGRWDGVKEALQSSSSSTPLGVSIDIIEWIAAQ